MKDTDDTLKAYREKLQIRREMPPEVLEHMARVYDLPHGASPAYGMTPSGISDLDFDLSVGEAFSLKELMRQTSESGRDSVDPVDVELLNVLEKIGKRTEPGSNQRGDKGPFGKPTEKR